MPRGYGGVAARNPPLAREHLTQALALVHETGYHRRDAEIAALERALEASTELKTPVHRA